MRLTRRTLLAGATGAALGLALAGCNDPGAKASSSSPTRRKKVRLTYGLVSIPKARGVLEQTLREQGVDVEWQGPFPNHAPTLQAVATNTADFSFGGSSTPAAQAMLSGAKLSFVSWSVRTPRNTSIIVLPSSGIKNVADLAGKTVAVNRAGVAEFLLVAALEKYRVPRELVKVVYLNPPDAAPAFAAGKVDAWAIWTGPLEMAEVQHGAQRIFVDGEELSEQFDFGTYVVRTAYARDEPDTIRKVLRAHQAELAWEQANYAEAQAIGYKFSKYPPEVVARLNQTVVTTKLSLMNDDGVAQLQRAVDWLSERKVLSGRLDVARHSERL
jgi:sulfonate transport system substrate-binding protein